jgi:hypothetical protein
VATFAGLAALAEPVVQAMQPVLGAPRDLQDVLGCWRVLSAMPIRGARP